MVYSITRERKRYRIDINGEFFSYASTLEEAAFIIEDIYLWE